MESVLSTEVSQGHCDWVFSTIHRHFNTWKPLGRTFSQSMTTSFGVQTPRWPQKAMLYHLHLPPERLFDPRDEAAFLVRAIGPNQLEPWEAPFKWLQEGFSTLVILDTGLMHQHVEDQTQGVDEQMPLVPFHFLPTVIPASPPF
jgi:hypothetical protein